MPRSCRSGRARSRAPGHRDPFTSAQMSQLAQVADVRMVLAASSAPEGDVIQFLAGTPELLAQVPQRPGRRQGADRCRDGCRRLGVGAAPAPGVTQVVSCSQVGYSPPRSSRSQGVYSKLAARRGRCDFHGTYGEFHDRKRNLTPRAARRRDVTREPARSRHRVRRCTRRWSGPGPRLGEGGSSCRRSGPRQARGGSTLRAAASTGSGT